MNQEIISKAAEIIKQNSVHDGEAGFGICTLSLIDENGFPTASIITPSKVDGINWITFGATMDSNKAKRIAKSNKASVCFSTMEHCVNLVGEIEIVTDADVKKEMWYDGLEGHCKGYDDPNYCVLKFTTKRYNLFVGFESEEGTL